MTIFSDPHTVASFDDLKLIVLEQAKKDVAQEYADRQGVTLEVFMEKLTAKEKAELDERAIVKSVEVAAQYRNLANRVSMSFAYTAVQRKLHERFDEEASVESWLKKQMDADDSQTSTSAAFLFEMLMVMDERDPGYSDSLFPNEISFRNLIRNIPRMRHERDNLYLTQRSIQENLEKKDQDLKVAKEKLRAEKDEVKREKIKAVVDRQAEDIKRLKKEGADAIRKADLILQETIVATFDVARRSDVNREESPLVIEKIVNTKLEELGVKRTPKPDVSKPIAMYYTDGDESLIVISVKKSQGIRVLGTLNKLLDTSMSEPEEMIRIIKKKIKK